MKKLIVSALLFLNVQPCYALLSPLNQSIEEVQSILQSIELQKNFPQSQVISTIQRSGNGYLLMTDQLQMQVDIQYIPIERPGRQQFKLVFYNPTPRGRN